MVNSRRLQKQYRVCFSLLLIFLFCSFVLLRVSDTDYGALAAESQAKPDRSVTPSQRQAAQQVFQHGNALLEKRRYSEAGVQYQKALRVVPHDPSLLWNAGLAAYLSKDYKKALVLWRRLKVVEPHDSHVRSKLIQTYQALGVAKELDAERKALFALRKSGKDPELSGQDSYCRDQFTVRGRDVFAYELFAFKGERAIRYRFLILKPDGTTDYILSLGSYQLTNEMARQSGTLQPDQRLFHLDGYYDRGRTHKTYAFFKEEPSYDGTKRLVRRIVAGEHKPISGSQRP